MEVCEDTNRTVTLENAIPAFRSRSTSSDASQSPCTVCWLAVSASDQISIGSKRKTLASLGRLSCNKIVWSSNYSPKLEENYDIIVRTVIVSKECGVSLATMKKMFKIMNIPQVMHHKIYTEIGLEVRDAAKAATEDAMRQSAAVVRERHMSRVCSSKQTSPSGMQVICVSYDGTWHKIGHSSHYGVDVAIDIDSGLVMDTHTLSNNCAGCKKAPPLDSANFNAWWSEKRKKCCNKNFDGSSNAMEMEAAAVIHSRSMMELCCVMVIPKH
ncbi:hypothetical protein PoB_003922900 [Plakobranchus ocellatus]|uniref:Mutator-like transposase domain-containing protein n=1 Tax=Plakobranchus ocellatus TaxID=259542 RepID=A0AAV4AY65_9GAST|nr:hypothetical protein PoB_003922900 [Plakobranchus ocellatus]